MSSSPFKDIKELIKDINSFMHRHKSTFNIHSKRVSDYFEMTSYNDVVEFYNRNGYKVEPQNLESGTIFRYKLSPTGLPENFSRFDVNRTYKKPDVTYEYEIHHNLSVESAVEKHIYYTPDISVVIKGCIEKTGSAYESGKKHCFAPNEGLQTFFEVKHLNPFPELLFNFAGLVMEMMPEVISRGHSNHIPKHLAPSMIISGGGNAHATRIQESLMSRYNINIFFGLFRRPSQIYSLNNNTVKIGRR